MNQIDTILTLSSFEFDKTYSYEINEKTPWAADFIDELEASLDKEEEYTLGKIKITLNILRATHKPFGDHLILVGNIKASYETPCVRCLVNTPQKIKAKFSVAFLHARFDKDPEYEEVTTIYTKGQNCDLYFYEKGKVETVEVLRELVFMNIEPLPLHDENCKGLCSKCGTDLNTTQCTHC